MVFTFDPHPARILHPEQAPAPLCWTERKAELLAGLGVDAVLAYPTDKAFLRHGSPRVFRPHRAAAGSGRAGWSKAAISSSATIATAPSR